MQLPAYLSVKLVLLSNLCWTWASGFFGRAIKAYQIYNAFSMVDWEAVIFNFTCNCLVLFDSGSMILKINMYLV